MTHVVIMERSVTAPCYYRVDSMQRMINVPSHVNPAKMGNTQHGIPTNLGVGMLISQLHAVVFEQRPVIDSRCRVSSTH